MGAGERNRGWANDLLQINFHRAYVVSQLLTQLVSDHSVMRCGAPLSELRADSSVFCPSPNHYFPNFGRTSLRGLA